MEYKSVEEFTKDLYEDGLDNSNLVNFVEELFSKIAYLESENAKLNVIIEDKTTCDSVEGNCIRASDSYFEIAEIVLGDNGGSVVETVTMLKQERDLLKAELEEVKHLAEEDSDERDYYKFLYLHMIQCLESALREEYLEDKTKGFVSVVLTCFENIQKTMFTQEKL